MLRKNQKGDPDCQSLAQWENLKATPTLDVLQASSSYLVMLAQHLTRLAEVDEILVLPEEFDGTKRVIVPTSLIGEVVEEAHQGPGTADEGVTKLMERQGIHITGLE